MNKQTAVNWLIKNLMLNGLIRLTQDQHSLYKELTEEAKAMEKQQMFECWETAHQAGRFEGKGIAIENWQTFKEYYNEEYGGNNEQQ